MPRGCLVRLAAALGSLHAVLAATDTSVHECMTGADLGMCAGHACPPYRHAALGPWLSSLRKSFMNQGLSAGKVAALKAVGVEFDGGKARIIREQHEAHGSKQAKVGFERLRRPARAPAGSASARVRMEVVRSNRNRVRGMRRAGVERRPQHFYSDHFYLNEEVGTACLTQA